MLEDTFSGEYLAHGGYTTYVSIGVRQVNAVNYMKSSRRMQDMRLNCLSLNIDAATLTIRCDN